MSTSVTQPPPPDAGITRMPLLIPSYVDVSPASSPSSTPTSTSIVLIIIIISSAIIVSASIYIILRLLSNRFRSAISAADVVDWRQDSSRVNPNLQQYLTPSSGVLDSLPLFTFSSVTGSLSGGDCAVCLSKFEPHDQLRLLPLCCHAFHSACIDTWIVSNQTCPLCRSSVLHTDADVLDKLLSAENHGNRNTSLRRGERNSGSFRIEIGSVSRRRGAAEELRESERHAYSIGSFEYIVDFDGCEIPAESTTQRRAISDHNSVHKDSSVSTPAPAPPGEALAADVSSSRNWLRDYVDRLASVSISRAMSFTSSGRFFSSSSRRSDPVFAAEDPDAYRVGEEISELFRWLSGI